MTNNWHYTVGDTMYTDCGAFKMPSQSNSAVQPNIDFWITLCRFCGGNHSNKLCPHVAEIEYHENGAVKRVVFKNGNGQFENMTDFLSSLNLPEE